MPKINNRKIKAVILDMDGVLWRENTPLADLTAVFNQFSNKGIPVTLATNNGTNTPDQYVNKLKKFGVQINPEQVVTSSMATAFLVKKEFPNGGPVYMMGSDALKTNLEEEGFYHSVSDPQAVVAGLKWDFDYQTIKETSLVIQRGIPFYYTNPDPTYPSPEGEVPGAGTLLAALESASGIKAKIAGKPQPYLFEVSMERMGSLPEETAVIGDRISTDILGGYNAGCLTVFVLSGINSMEDLENLEIRPDLIIENINDLFSSI